jgi:hypothetical protein
MNNNTALALIVRERRGVRGFVLFSSLFVKSGYTVLFSMEQPVTRQCTTLADTSYQRCDTLSLSLSLRHSLSLSLLSHAPIY